MAATEVVDAPETVTETPQADPNTPAETSPAPADTQETADGALTPDAETAPPSEGPARDAEGRFTKADGTLSEPGEALPPAPDVEPDLSAYEAFTYKVDGQDLPYQGAVRDEEGNVLFTKEAVQQLRHDLAYARSYPRLMSDSKRSIDQERSGRQAAEATVSTVLGKLEQMFEQSQNASTWEEFAQTPLGLWIQDRHAKWPQLKAEGVQKGFEVREKAAAQRLKEYESRDAEAAELPIMLARVEEAVTAWGPEAGLTAAEQRDLIRAFSERETLERIFPRSTHDDPVTGKRAGQRGENLDVIKIELRRIHGLLKNRTTPQAAADVVKENARRTGKTGQQPPPTPGVGRTSSPAREKTKVYKSTREADEDIWS